jgi:exodeoxyribonuclease VII small subunit
MAKKAKFEEALGKLEQIVQRLEKGEESLEESLKLFEEGMKLAKLCSLRLEEAQRKVEILKRTEDGKLKRQPFPAQENGETGDEETKPDNDAQLML